MYFDDRKNNFAWHYSLDGIRIFIGRCRESEFMNLLQKVVARDFDELTLGELWTAEDLLKTLQDNQSED